MSKKNNKNKHCLFCDEIHKDEIPERCTCFSLITAMIYRHVEPYPAMCIINETDILETVWDLLRDIDIPCCLTAQFIAEEIAMRVMETVGPFAFYIRNETGLDHLITDILDKAMVYHESIHDEPDDDDDEDDGPSSLAFLD